MTEHVFLTGRKQVGKSTLIRKELERYKKENGEESAPSEENLLFICGSADRSRSDERFDRMGSRILEESMRNGAELLIMDDDCYSDSANLHK